VEGRLKWLRNQTQYCKKKEMTTDERKRSCLEKSDNKEKTEEIVMGDYAQVI
jgi:hypothetical protein